MEEFDDLKARMDRGCTRKTGTYTSRQAAKLYAKRIQKAEGQRYYPYRCPYCRLWHLTTGHGDSRSL